VRDTTPPTCTVTGVIAGPPKKQDVTAVDSGSGIASEGVTNITIDNGTVAVPAVQSASTSGLVVEATKSDQTMLTHWSFDLADWAGNTKHCV